jgi:hypothetical protein
MGKILWQVWLDDRLDNVLETIKDHFHNSGILKSDAKAQFLVYIIELFVEDYFKYLSSKLNGEVTNREFLEQFKQLLITYQTYKNSRVNKNGG